MSEVKRIDPVVLDLWVGDRHGNGVEMCDDEEYGRAGEPRAGIFVRSSVGCGCSFLLTREQAAQMHHWLGDWLDGHARRIARNPIRALRIEAGLSLREAAKRAGLTPVRWGEIERGVRGKPTPAEMESIKRVLDEAAVSRGSSRGSAPPDAAPISQTPVIIERANGLEPSTFSLGSKLPGFSEAENAENVGDPGREGWGGGDEK